MTRLISLIAAVTLASVSMAKAAPAATPSQTTTYVDGNLMGVAPNTGGTLVFSDEKIMTLRTGLTSVSIPYASISKAELSVTKSHGHDAPKIEIWKHIGSGKKTETQYLVVNFKNETGQDKTMTLELAHAAAPVVLDTIHAHMAPPAAQSTAVASAAQPPSKDAKPASTPTTQAAAPKKPAKPADDWWGDDFWKTTRNVDKWAKAAGTASGEPDQRQQQ